MLETQILGNIRDYLRWVFADATRITDTSLQSFIWTSSEDTTKIKIDTGGLEDYSDIGRTPAIFISSAPSTARSMNPLIDYTVEVASVNQTSNSEVSMDTGQTMVTCMGVTPAQARALGREVYDKIRAYSSTLKDDFSLFHISADQTYQVQPQGEVKISLIRQVALSWIKFDAWTVTHV